MRFASIAMIALSVTSGPSHARNPYVAEGHQYDIACKRDGYELKSINPVARLIGAGAGRQMITGTETLYLGRSCDASHKLFGTGKWCWANGGFFATFPTHTFEFVGQELWCEPPRDYDLNCSC